jgi:hypothetical protein
VDIGSGDAFKTGGGMRNGVVTTLLTAGSDPPNVDGYMLGKGVMDAGTVTPA